MSDLSSRPWERDLEGKTLRLTSECETSQELASFLEACAENTTVRTVAFRESFLPLRRIRQHLTRNEFFQMLQAVCQLKSLVRMVIPPTMPGMLRGITASYFLPDWPDDEDEGTDDESYDEELYSSNLQEWIVNDAVTFCTINDVCAIADSIEELCPKLHWIEIQNFYFKQFRTSSRKQRQQQQPNSSNNQSDKDDDDGECLLDPLFHSLATQSQLTGLKLSTHPDYTPAVELTFDASCLLSFAIVTPRSIDSLLTRHCNTLQHVTLSRLGLTDQDFRVIANSLPKLHVLETLNLNENAQTHSGTMSILEALPKLTLSHQLMSLSLRPMSQDVASSNHMDCTEVEMDWALVFPRNLSLRYLETRAIRLGYGIADDEHDSESESESDNDSDESSNEGQNHAKLALLEFWLHTNRMHRCMWGQIAPSESSLWPVLLERLGENSVSAQWHCLQTFLPQMQHFQ
mmetsp:Transcript_18995/g.47047  ORF Transcript_18995/g.47047 Transcript_18995/m.47047 type:complete len:460 (+) Transcript_18995:48-1427(+)